MDMPKEEATVLLKLKPEVREALKKQAGQHKLSMQKVVEALVEGWLWADAPIIDLRGQRSSCWWSRSSGWSIGPGQPSCA